MHSRTNALIADHETSDISIVEFPIIYYIVSILYKIFGPHEVLFRLVNILIGFLGLYYLFRSGILILNNRYFALLISLIIFSSPIYVFYTNNFIPDATCLSIAFIGIFYFLRYQLKRHTKDWLISLSLFLLAGLIKTPSLIFFFTVLSISFLDMLGLKASHIKKVYPSVLILISSVFGVIIVLVG